MTLHTGTFDYQDDHTILEAYYAYQDSKEKKPVILVVHDWSGKNKFACDQADALATLGYVGIAVDMFGKGKIGQNKEEKSALIQPFLQDRSKILQRLQAALHAIQKREAVDQQRIGAIGFCFGGLCVLDLARSGIALSGVVSFHGLLNAPENATHHAISGKVLVLHGYDDPMAPPTQVMQFADEMNHANADWQINMYGHTLHAFMNPEAHDKNFGTVYNATTAKRAWRAMTDFFREVF